MTCGLETLTLRPAPICSPALSNSCQILVSLHCRAKRRASPQTSTQLMRWSLCGTTSFASLDSKEASTEVYQQKSCLLPLHGRQSFLRWRNGSSADCLVSSRPGGALSEFVLILHRTAECLLRCTQCPRCLGIICVGLTNGALQLRVAAPTDMLACRYQLEKLAGTFGAWGEVGFAAPDRCCSMLSRPEASEAASNPFSEACMLFASEPSSGSGMRFPPETNTVELQSMRPDGFKDTAVSAVPKQR